MIETIVTRVGIVEDSLIHNSKFTIQNFRRSGYLCFGSIVQ